MSQSFCAALLVLAGVCGLCTLVLGDEGAPDYSAAILTPPAPPTPRINGPSVYGARPGRPFLYAIPATGNRPMTFSVDGMPPSLHLEAKTGQITGSVTTPGNYTVTLGARNAFGKTQRSFQIKIGDAIALTPPMGWNSWNCWGGAVTQDKVLRAGRVLVASGLARHGWTYVNIDDTWQGKPDPQTHALQGNEKFPDIQGLCGTLHGMGLKAGIYSTPWIGSYDMYPGGSADTADRAWNPPPQEKYHTLGPYSFATQDARQWAEWGIDYLKYDWRPNDVPHVQEMADALRASGRDIVFSLSNTAPFMQAPDWARLANVWRTTDDIRDDFRSLCQNGFTQAAWAPYAGPGHWNDPDMMVVGWVGWGPNDLHASHLTADEQYTHLSLWCLLSAPLLLGCDLEKLDPFTLSLLTNDEVLAIDQDALGRAAQRVSATGDPIDLYALPSRQVWAKPLADGSYAVGLFNLSTTPTVVTANFADWMGTGPQRVRDLWRQKDLGTFSDKYEATVAPHGVVLLKIVPAR